MRNRTKFSPNQLILIFAGPIVVLALSYLAYSLAGIAALLLPPVLIGILLLWTMIEVRHYALGQFDKQSRERRAMFSQLEALIGITRTLDPTLPLPPTRGWSASPDLLREIMDHVIHDRPELVVEASSGTSTLVIAYCLRRIGKGRVISLEHDPKYAARTRRALRSHGLESHAEVLHAPLVKQTVDGKDLLWYDLSAITIEGTIDMLIVDGPPDTTTRCARFPALPLLRKRFGPGTTVLLDDGAREDETETAERWANEFNATEIEYLPLEKGAWLLRF